MYTTLGMQIGHSEGGLEYAMTQNGKKYKAKWEQQNVTIPRELGRRQ